MEEIIGSNEVTFLQYLGISREVEPLSQGRFVGTCGPTLTVLMCYKAGWSCLGYICVLHAEIS